ncbi:MAG: hypothetical protein O7G85_00840 [Planctomycetota bacterium]|nr:hypothetical protein [Planctomycetota bacterium]
MPILDQLRRFIRPAKHSHDMSDPRLIASGSVETRETKESTDAPDISVQSFREEIEDVDQAEVLVVVEAESSQNFDEESEFAVIEVTDASHLARIEPKPMSQDVVSPQEFIQTTNVLTEGIDELRSILAEQTSMLQAIAPNLNRVDQAISKHEALSKRIDTIHENVESLTEQMTRVLGSMNNLAQRVTSVQQIQQTQSDQLKSQEGAIQQAGQKLTALEHNQRESNKSLESSLDRIKAETSAMDHRLDGQRTLVVLAAVGATTAAILSLITLITS